MENVRQIRVYSADDAPNPHPVPIRERAAGDMCKDDPPDLVRELQAPCAQEGDEDRGVDDGGVVHLWLRKPSDLDACSCGEREQ